MTKYIVTGGAGFIGSHLVEALVKKNKKVLILDNLSTGRINNIKSFKNKIRFINCDISREGNWMKEFRGKCIVFHLASLADIVPSIENPIKYFESNVKGTLNVLNSCRKAKVLKFVYSASSSCYGIPKNYPTKENEKMDPKFPYALTKKMGEDLIVHWAKVYKIPFISLRLFNVYGTRSRTAGTYGAMFGVFLAQKLAKKPYTIVGNGKQTRDFTYVDDIVQALVVVAKNKCKNKVYNAGSGKTISINRIIEQLKGEKVFIPKRPSEPECTFADISLIKDDTWWNPKITIETGIEELMKNINYWKNAPVWNPNSIKEATKDWFKYLKDK